MMCSFPWIWTLICRKGWQTSMLRKKIKPDTNREGLEDKQCPDRPLSYYNATNDMICHTHKLATNDIMPHCKDLKLGASIKMFGASIFLQSCRGAQQILSVFLQKNRGCRRTISFHNLSFPVHKKLGKVPLDRIP
nr:hypothetical protein Iba_chr12bCG12740 [Ipomoea batatas]